MSVSTFESENAQPVAQTQNSELIYRLEDRPPLAQTLFAACQHLLAMFVAVITPALLICQALGLPAQDTQHIISMSLFASGVASIIQIKAWGPVGSGLLSIQGTSFNFVAPLIMGGTALKTGGADVPTMMAALFGTLMLASCTEMVISRVLHLARRIITPLVSGVVVMIIGLSLIQVGLTSIGGGYAAMSDNTFGAPKNLLLAGVVLALIIPFGAPKNLLLAGVVLALIILLNRQRNPYLRVASLVIAMAAGYALAWFMDMLPESNEPMTQELIMVPTPLYYGLGIEWSLLLPLMLVFMITSLETIGDITATSDVSEQPVSGPLYMKRLKGGVLANGLNSFVSAVFNTFPNSCFGQNNGVIQLTGVASRYVGFVVALMLIVLGLFPAVSGFVQHIPEPVLGGATLVMFGTIAASGVRIVSREPLNRRAILIIALSLAVGLGVSQQPLILQFAPDWLKNLLSSGIAAGGITAIVLNLIFPPEKQ
ncbi:xanthine/proton symporter XanP [Escherichia marmotae]|uniref:xanthine/proton symporter XanP n=1 Tax=Escherichia marmotae TaxID=1499973 RepID=UPI0030CAB9C0